MARQSKSILKQKEADVKISFKAPASVKKGLDDLKERISKEAPEMELDINEMLADHLETLIDTANKELDKIKPSSGNKAGHDEGGSGNAFVPQENAAMA